MISEILHSRIESPRSFINTHCARHPLGIVLTVATPGGQNRNKVQLLEGAESSKNMPRETVNIRSHYVKHRLQNGFISISLKCVHHENYAKFGRDPLLGRSFAMES